MMTRAAILEINDHLQRSIAPIAIRFKRLLNLRKRKSMRDEPRRIDVPAPDGPLRDLHERPQVLGHARVNREALAHDWLERDLDILSRRDAEVQQPPVVARQRARQIELLVLVDRKSTR